MDHDTDSSATRDFRLGDWLVQPNLNRLSSDEKVVQIEPKLMDVLVFLATKAGEVVSKNDITDAVWPDVFITESVITRSIAGLRRAFGDDAKSPLYIETISKRGYRLIAEVAYETQHREAPMLSRQPEIAPSTGGTPLPYVIGQWVRGERFYGRTATIQEVLAGNRNWLWLLGTRRIGKTSLLKQLEMIAATAPELGFVPVFWDLQGADSPEELHLDFADALLDAEEHLERAGIPLPEIQSEDCFDSMARLRRALLAKNLRLLLLCDEVEELINLNRQDPSLLRKLRRALQSREGIRSVLASSPRLWRLADAGADTSPFLDGFTPPVAIGPLDAPAARSLILQTNLPEPSRPEVGEQKIERIRTLCGGHPYLIQMLCRHALDSGDLDEAVEHVHNDRAVSFFFAVDFELITEVERDVLLRLAEGDLVPSQPFDGAPQDLPIETGASLANLSSLGLVRREPNGRYSVGNVFLKRWLVERPDAGRT
jgi:DNA-binding winged helix-turn-helix (wHTH) protein